MHVTTLWATQSYNMKVQTILNMKSTTTAHVVLIIIFALKGCKNNPEIHDSKQLDRRRISEPNATDVQNSNYTYYEVVDTGDGSGLAKQNVSQTASMAQLWMNSRVLKPLLANVTGPFNTRGPPKPTTARITKRSREKKEKKPTRPSKTKKSDKKTKTTQPPKTGQRHRKSNTEELIPPSSTTKVSNTTQFPNIMQPSRTKMMTLPPRKRCTWISCRAEPDLRHHPLFGKKPRRTLKYLRSRLLGLKRDDWYIEDLVTNISVTLHTANMEQKNGREDQDVALNLLHEVANNLSDILGAPGNGSYEEIETAGYNLLFGIRNINFKNYDGYAFPNTLQSNLNGFKVELSKNIFNFTGTKGQGYGKIVSLIYAPIKSMIDNAASSNATLYDKVISTSVTPLLQHDLDGDDLVQLSFSKQKSNSSHHLKHVCVFWNFSLSEWSDKGCSVNKQISNDSHTVCSCVHLTDFSVLMRVQKAPITEKDSKALHLITLTGCCVSCVFLLFTITVVVSSRILRKQHRYKIHVNLSASLIFGNVLYLTIDVIKKHENYCFIFAVLVYYFYLSSFCWMLCEVVFIWRALIRVFTERDRFCFYFLLGWGTPVIIVGICALVFKRNMIDMDSCWLSWRHRAIWGFVAPALLIIVVNLIVILVSLFITMKHVKNTAKGTFRTYARLTFFLIPVFGTTWIFGVLAFHKDLVVFQYIFAILNSLQGFFIFLFYICCSNEVRLDFRKTRLHKIVSTKILPTTSASRATIT